MDEPESGLDLRHTAQLIKLIKELCKTDNKQVLFITHRPEHALMIADKTLLFLPDNELLHTSFVLWGDTKNILCQENLEQAYGISFAIGEYGRKGNICQEKKTAVFVTVITALLVVMVLSVAMSVHHYEKTV